MKRRCRFQWPHGLRLSSAASQLLRLWVQIPQGAWMSICCEFCLLSGTGLCDELITRPGEILPTVERRCVWSRNLVNEEALAHRGLSRQIQTNTEKTLINSDNYKRENANHVPRCVNSAVDLFLLGESLRKKYTRRPTMNCITHVEGSVMIILMIWLTLRFLWPLQRHFLKSSEVHPAHSSFLYVD